ncbi:MAG: hypothetical protein SFU86_07495 [Pirellulaceae bacterium]|nr:hypothetical protein [Pirellulaceae bacterium]
MSVPSHEEKIAAIQSMANVLKGVSLDKPVHNHNGFMKANLIEALVQIGIQANALSAEHANAANSISEDHNKEELQRLVEEAVKPLAGG